MLKLATWSVWVSKLPPFSQVSVILSQSRSETTYALPRVMMEKFHAQEIRLPSGMSPHLEFSSAPHTLGLTSMTDTHNFMSALLELRLTNALMCWDRQRQTTLSIFLSPPASQKKACIFVVHGIISCLERGYNTYALTKQLFQVVACH